jgi:hypothetical protein
MTYAQLLSKLKRLGLGQVSRMTHGDYDVARIGRPSEVDAVLRRFGETRERFDPPN